MSCACLNSGLAKGVPTATSTKQVTDLLGLVSIQWIALRNLAVIGRRNSLISSMPVA